MTLPISITSLGMLTVGGGGGQTFIAGGAEITVSLRPATIDITPGESLDIQTGGITLDVAHAGKALDLQDDRYTVDL